MQTMQEMKKTYAIVGKGREQEERSLVLVENGVYLGHGFASTDFAASSFEELKERITTYQDNQDIQKILNMHLSHDHKDEVIYF